MQVITEDEMLDSDGQTSPQEQQLQVQRLPPKDSETNVAPIRVVIDNGGRKPNEHTVLVQKMPQALNERPSIDVFDTKKVERCYSMIFVKEIYISFYYCCIKVVKCFTTKTQLISITRLQL